MSHMSKSRLLATSAIAGLSFLHLASPAAAQSAFGIHNEQPDPLTVAVDPGQVVEGGDSGIYADNGPVDINNAGTIRGNGTIFGNAETRPSAGVVIAQPGSTIVNSGEISGAANGVATSYFFSEDANGDNLPPQPLAADTSVTNSGLIRGDAGAGVSLYGGGDVTNSGTIRALTGTAGNGAQAVGVFIGEFPDAIAQNVTGVGSITNTANGLIEGQLNGAVLQGGGTVDNAGIIRSTGAFNPLAPSNPPIGLAIGASEAQTGRSATVNNSGTIDGFIGMGVSALLDEATINNDGLINGSQIGITSGGSMTINNGAEGRILGTAFAINAGGGVLTLDNQGLIRGTLQAGVNILGADGSVTNSGTIEGVFGITTNAVQVSPGVSEIRSFNTAIDNSGTIIGINNDGVRLQGGGRVTNSGNIEGRLNAQADGVSIFHVDGQGLSTYSASLTNAATGTISGNRFGAIISSGGEVDNAGAITGRAGGIVIQNGLADPGITGALINSGTITGSEGAGVSFDGLEASTTTNGGTITGLVGDGIYIFNPRGTVTTIDNGADGVITGSESGIHAELGGLELTNAGKIRGNGAEPGLDGPPDAGVTLSGGPSSVVNSGTITGTGFGITTASYFNPITEEAEYLTQATSVVNSGTIIGESDDGVRLIGGGTVTNSGIIYGQIAQFADGISMFAYTQQPNEGYSALVTNEADGEIVGNRFGIILSGGGSVENAGSIAGGVGGLFLQGTALNTDPGEDRSSLTASVVNSGTIRGLSPNGSSGGDGYGVGFGSDMSSATLENSGEIISDTGAGVSSGTRADVSVTNLADGTITGGKSGIYSFATGTIAITNAGRIRGNGTYDGFAAAPDAGITIATGSSSVTNSGTISGAGAGITTAYQFDESTGELVLLAVGTQVANSGTIIGEANDGVRLIGGGSLANSGTITGIAGVGTDGVSMFRGEGQASQGYAALVTNSASGEISGARFGVILSEGGRVENDGAITGDGAGGLLIQQGLAEPGAAIVDGTFVNGGTITGTNGYGAVITVANSAVIENSGTIAGATFGALIEAQATATGQAGTIANSGTISGASAEGVVVTGAFAAAEVVNGGAIRGATAGVAHLALGTLALTNTGSITATTGPGVVSTSQIVLDNSGTISGGDGLAVQLGAFDDNVTLRTGSAIDGVIDAGDGVDRLFLAGDVLELTAAQQLTAAAGFEELTVGSGYWSTAGAVGAFDNVVIDAGAALQVNEVAGQDGAESPILTPAVANAGLLVLNFGDDETVSDLDALSITGAGRLQLIGDAVFTVDTASIAHTGGTTISNGGLVLTGLLQGNVVTEGNGYFELGAGGTEGSFAGDIVNNGRFVFNRSDDYDFLGAFSGSGTLDKMGAGILTFMGDYNFRGVTNIFGGLVRIGGVIDPETEFNLGDGGTLDITGQDQTIAGLAGEQNTAVNLGENNLTVNQQQNSEFAGTIAGEGGFTKSGAGTLNLTGDSSYTGPTVVDEGKLAVNGSIVSPVTVNAGGSLGGNGSVGSTTVGSGGGITPGNSIGRLTVNGDLAFAAGSFYEVEVNAAGQADRIDATGTVTIASTARVDVLAEQGNYNPRTDYVILTGAGGITGTFGSVTSDLAFLDPVLRYSLNTVTLSLYRNDVDFTDVASGFNQIGVAAAIQARGIDDPIFEAVLPLNAVGAQAAFADLSGEVLASSISGLTDDSRHLRNAILGMQAPEAEGLFVWGSGFGGWGDFDAGANNAGLDTDHKGFVTGVGYGGNGFGAAISAGIGSSDFALVGRGDRAKAGSKYLAAHLGYGAGEGFRGSVGISYAWHDIDSNRSVSVGPIVQALTSNRDADTLQLFGELGYGIVMGHTAISPFARLAHVRTKSDAFVEAGGSTALAVAKAEQETTFISLGLQGRFNAGQPGLQPFASLAWNHASGDRGAPVAAAFASGGPVFGLIGNLIPKNSAEVEAGLDYNSGPVRVGAAYSGTLASGRSSHGVRLTARIVF